MSETPYQPTSPLPGIHLGETKNLPDTLLAGLEERQDMLTAFAHDPENPEIWNYAAVKALEEESENLGQPRKLAAIPTSSLIEFAQSVRIAAPEDRYTLTTALAPNGDIWFDALHGFHGPSGNTAIANAVRKQLHDLGVSKVDVAVDIGTGTGETAAAVAPLVERMVGLDKNPALLEVAQNKHPEIQFVEGSATHLPFADESVDIITSNGLKYSQSRDSAIQMYSEIARVLKEDGVYIDADWVPAKDIVLSVHPFGGVNNPDFHPEELAASVTWRAVLQDMIVDTVSGKFQNKDALSMAGHEWSALKLRLGLYETNYRMVSDFSSMLARARVLHKNPAAAAAHERQARAFIRSTMD